MHFTPREAADFSAAEIAIHSFRLWRESRGHCVKADTGGAGMQPASRKKSNEPHPGRWWSRLGLAEGAAPNRQALRKARREIPCDAPPCDDPAVPQDAMQGRSTLIANTCD